MYALSRHGPASYFPSPLGSPGVAHRKVVSARNFHKSALICSPVEST